MNNDMITFVFWDVQHGSATYIKTPNGKSIVIDLGTGSYRKSRLDFSPLLRLKRKWGINQLHGVIITHPHADHLGDVINLNELNPIALERVRHLNEYDIRTGNPHGVSDIIETYIRIDKQSTAPVPEEINPFLAKNNGGVEFRFFDPSSSSTSNLNNHSLVTVASFMGLKVLIPGDNEPPSWNELLGQEEFRSAIAGTDVMLAPHHGRDSGFSKELFLQIQPRLTIISDGPSCDTSATDRYIPVTSGWTVHRRNGEQESRKCLTTRHDGVVLVKIGLGPNRIPFLSVTID